MAKQLKAYMYKDDEEEFRSSIIYHFTSKEAKKLGVKRIGYEGDYIAIQCQRHPDADKYAAEAAEPGIENDDKKLRILGWSYEGEERCDTCGLSPMGMDEFEICSECGQCPECEHSKDCSETLEGGE